MAVDGVEVVEDEPSASRLNGDGDGRPVDEAPLPEAPLPEAEPYPVEDYVGPAAEEPNGWDGRWGAGPAPAPQFDAPIEEPDAYHNQWASKKKSKKKVLRVETPPPPEPSDFASLSFPLLAPRDNHKDGCEPSEAFDLERIYSNVFLAHAKLWALADIHSIDTLKALALHKLHKTLSVFETRSENAGDVIELVRYAYTKGCGGSRPEEEVGGGLRELVAQYMAFNSRELSRSAEFTQLLGEGGLFVQDFFRIVMEKRI